MPIPKLGIVQYPGMQKKKKITENNGRERIKQLPQSMELFRIQLYF